MTTTSRATQDARSNTTLVDRLRRGAQERPDVPALISLDVRGHEVGRTTHRELDERARATAALLLQRCSTGDRVLLIFADHATFLPAFLACLYSGTVAVPVAYPAGLHGSANALATVLAVVRDARPALALVADVPPEWCDALAAEVTLLTAADATPAPPWTLPIVAPSDLALLQYTSGSTRSPRGVMVTHANLAVNLTDVWTHLAAARLRHEHDMVIVSWLPHYHDMGLAQLLIALWTAGTTVVLPPIAFLVAPVTWLAAISRYRAVATSAPDIAYLRCSERVDEQQRAALDLSSLRCVLTGSEPIRRHTLLAFEHAFAAQGMRPDAWLPSYGLAEATVFVTGWRTHGDTRWVELQGDSAAAGDASAAGAGAASRAVVGCGRWPTGLELLIVDPQQRTRCRDGASGEIWLRGPSVSPGYWGEPARSAGTFDGQLAGTDEGPFLRTSDIGFVRDGQLFVLGRMDGVLVVHGRNHHGQDIAATAESSCGDLEPGGCAVLLDDTGERAAGRTVLVAELRRRRRVPPDGTSVPTEQVVRAAVLRQHQLSLDTIVLVRPGSLPRTTSGKLRWDALRQRLRDGDLAQVTT